MSKRIYIPRMSTQRELVTSLIRATNGRVYKRETACTVYEIHCSEKRLLKLRDKIPFRNLWTSSVNGVQYLTVYFNEIA